MSPGSNTMRMGIADGGDQILDSWVLIQGGSLTTTPPVEGTCVDLIAAQDTVAGEVCVTNDGENLTVTYTTIDGWMLTETTCTSRTTRTGCRRIGPATRRSAASLISGNHDPAVDAVTYTIPLSDLDAEAGDQLAIAAHAVVEREDAGEIRVESAWGEGQRFVERGNWAMWFGYAVQ